MSVALETHPPVRLTRATSSLKIKIVLDLLKLALTDEQAGEKTDHHLGHMQVNRISSTLESID